MYEDKYAEKEKELKSNNYQGKILLLDDFIEDEFYVYETITGDYNNDGIRDKFLIIDTNQEDAMGMRVPFENYLIRIVLGIEDSKKFKFLFESHTILPCLNCEKWENSAEYSFSRTKLEKGSLSFITNQYNENMYKQIMYKFSFVDCKMMLYEIGNYGIDSGKTTTTYSNFNKVSLDEFNIYSYYFN